MWGELFSVSFWDFSCFLDELVLPGSCSILELRFLNCAIHSILEIGSCISMVFAVFKSLDLSLGWHCNILEHGNMDLSCAWYLQYVGLRLVRVGLGFV